MKKSRLLNNVEQIDEEEGEDEDMDTNERMEM
jgi:hypothetical protein